MEANLFNRWYSFSNLNKLEYILIKFAISVQFIHLMCIEACPKTGGIAVLNLTSFYLQLELFGFITS